MDFTHTRVYQILSSILEPLESEMTADDNNVIVDEDEHAWLHDSTWRIGFKSFLCDLFDNYLLFVR